MWLWEFKGSNDVFFLKPVTLKEVVQVHSKRLRGVPGAGVSNCHLGPPASESQGFQLAL